jgi:hypothetical protein
MKRMKVSEERRNDTRIKKPSYIYLSISEKVGGSAMHHHNFAFSTASQGGKHHKMKILSELLLHAASNWVKSILSSNNDTALKILRMAKKRARIRSKRAGAAAVATQSQAAEKLVPTGATNRPQSKRG